MAAFDTQFESVHVANFTAFRKLQLDLSPGLNVLIGPNATGKTHLMKVLYASAAVSEADTDLGEKLVGVFVPHQRRIGRLVTRRQGSAECQVTIHRPQRRLSIRFSSHAQPTSKTPPTVTGLQRWRESPTVSAFIPVKEMLTGGAQLVALYRLRELELEEVYVDSVTRALLPLARGQVDARRQKLLDTLNREMSGKVETAGRLFDLDHDKIRDTFVDLVERDLQMSLQESAPCPPREEQQTRCRYTISASPSFGEATCVQT